MVKLSINYIDDNGVRQIFSGIKSNLDSINNTAVSAYARANEAYSIASEGSITPGTQKFNIEGGKMFNITNGYFRISINNGASLPQSDFLLHSGRLYYRVNLNSVSSVVEVERNCINLSVNPGHTGAYINVSDKGIYMYDGKGHQGYINVANCI